MEKFCNKCGKSCVPKEFFKSVLTTTASNNPDNYGLIDATFESGYFSKHLEDGFIYKFSLCEKCLSRMFNKFKIPINKIRY